MSHTQTMQFRVIRQLIAYISLAICHFYFTCHTSATATVSYIFQFTWGQTQTQTPKKKIQQKPRQPAKLQSSLRRKFTHFSATLSGPSRAGFTPIGLSWVVFLPENSPKCNKHARYSATHSYIDTFDGLLKCKETKRAKLDMADSLEASHFKP